jgi:hypothetical protein
MSHLEMGCEQVCQRLFDLLDVVKRDDGGSRTPR